MALHTKVFLLGFRVVPQLRGPAGLGCTALGTAYQGILGFRAAAQLGCAVEPLWAGGLGSGEWQPET